jgi:hypothetical protein
MKRQIRKPYPFNGTTTINEFFKAINEICDFHIDKDSHYDLLVYITVQSGAWILQFWRNVLPPSSG